MGLQTTFKTGVISDEDLLDEIRLVVKNETEHLSKQKLNSSSIKAAQNFNVNSVQTFSPEKNLINDKKPKENPVLVEIQKLNVKVSQLSTVQDEVAALKRQFASSYPLKYDDENRQRNFNRQSRRRILYHCASCEQSDSNFCNHCFNCGSTEHRRNQCKKNE